MLMGAGLTVDGAGAMVVANDTKFAKKRRFRKLAVGNKKVVEAERRERRGGEGDTPLRGGGGVDINVGLAMDADLY